MTRAWPRYAAAALLAASCGAGGYWAGSRRHREPPPVPALSAPPPVLAPSAPLPPEIPAVPAFSRAALEPGGDLMPLSAAPIDTAGQVLFEHSFFGMPPEGRFSLVDDAVRHVVDGRDMGAVRLSAPQEIPAAERPSASPFFQGPRRMVRAPVGDFSVAHDLVMTFVQRVPGGREGELKLSLTRSTFHFSPGVRSWRHVKIEWGPPGGPYRVSFARGR